MITIEALFDCAGGVGWAIINTENKKFAWSKSWDNMKPQAETLFLGLINPYHYKTMKVEQNIGRC